jgi:hypothetical protein
MGEHEIPTVETRLGIGDHLGRWRMRWAIGRSRYRVRPGLYRVGVPDSESLVLVTANYKLTFDTLRSSLEGVDAWLLVLDTDGVNVWCAAGKGTFGTGEIVKRVRETSLEEIVSHRKLVVPQLGATGVSAHEVKRLCGFRVVYGPVRAGDIKTYIGTGMHATDEMRRVTFPLRERAALTGADLGIMFKWLIPILLLLVVWKGGINLESAGEVLRAGAPILAGLFTGIVLVPILLPWIPGRAFSLKGAIAGTAIVGGVIAIVDGGSSIPKNIDMLLLGTTAASFFAMQFTGATTFTSPSGVEWEMRRALPFQIAAIAVAAGVIVFRAIGA